MPHIWDLERNRKREAFVVRVTLVGFFIWAGLLLAWTLVLSR